MADDIQRATDALADRNNTWVARRDAAEWLGKAAGRAVHSLLANRVSDGDRDVQDAINRALSDAKQTFGKAAASPGPLTIEALVKAVERPGTRDVTPVDGGYAIKVALRDGRSQTLTVTQAKSQSGGDTVRISTRCGPATDKALRWALKTNGGFTHCGMTLVEENGQSWFDLVNAILLETATVDEFKACIKEMAFYGDWAETKVSSGDTH